MYAQQLLFQDTTQINRKEAARLLANVKHTEKKTFPAKEVFNFDTELKKHNTHLICAIDSNQDQNRDASPVAYLLYARTGRVALLHKICVVQSHRGKGIGTQMMTWLLAELAKNGCGNVQLWVDESREPARALYVSLGFRQVDYVVDYYSPGRAGLKTNLSLQSG